MNQYAVKIDLPIHSVTVWKKIILRSHQTVLLWQNQRLSPDIRITRNPDLPAHFGTRIPDTPNLGTQMSDKHYFNAFFGSFFAELYRPYSNL